MESQIPDEPPHQVPSNPDLEDAENRPMPAPQLSQESSSNYGKPCKSHQQSNSKYTVDPRRSHAMPIITLTSANETLGVPAGRIVDDSSRGFLFWEKTPGHDIAAEQSETTSSSNWTASFRIKWLSPAGKILPFTKTKHLRNSYNDNKPVKVAKDGTEIDPIVGEQLIELFRV